MVHFRNYSAPPYDIREILRYAGVRGASPETEALLRECLEEIQGKLACKVCWTEFPVRRLDGQLDLGFAATSSAALTAHLETCQHIIVFAATVGIGLDRLIARYSKVSPAKALLFQAIGAERIEALCDAFCRDMAAEQAVFGNSITRRFSPGYGDLPLALQRDIFQVLDCPRKIGLTLNESLLMSPSKSVTALIGVTTGRICGQPDKSGCSACQHESCIYRRNQ